jgi:hypothetical protein
MDRASSSRHNVCDIEERKLVLIRRLAPEEQSLAGGD